MWNGRPFTTHLYRNLMCEHQLVPRPRKEGKGLDTHTMQFTRDYHVTPIAYLLHVCGRS